LPDEKLKALVFQNNESEGQKYIRQTNLNYFNMAFGKHRNIYNKIITKRLPK